MLTGGYCNLSITTHDAARLCHRSKPHAPQLTGIHRTPTELRRRSRKENLGQTVSLCAFWPNSGPTVSARGLSCPEAAARQAGDGDGPSLQHHTAVSSAETFPRITNSIPRDTALSLLWRRGLSLRPAVCPGRRQCSDKHRRYEVDALFSRPFLSARPRVDQLGDLCPYPAPSCERGGNATHAAGLQRRQLKSSSNSVLLFPKDAWGRRGRVAGYDSRPSTCVSSSPESFFGLRMCHNAMPSRMCRRPSRSQDGPICFFGLLVLLIHVFEEPNGLFVIWTLGNH